jgi:hemerythrin-like domain-containing protein
MLRDKNLIPLSRQHQHALALCVRIYRAQPIGKSETEVWQLEIEKQFEQEMKNHFSAEESVLFPTARHFSELVPLVDDLIADHFSLRKLFSQAERRLMSSETLPEFAQQLSAHIRKEERQLFERMQKLMTTAELDMLGTKMEAALKDAAQSCVLKPKL